MTENKNLDALKRCYALWDETKGRSAEAWLDLMDDNVKFVSLAKAKSPAVGFTAERTCKDDLVCYLKELLADWEMEYYAVEDYVVDGNKICAIGTTAWTNKNTGIRAESPKLDYVTFENGKIVEFREFYDTATLIAAASGLDIASLGKPT